MKFFTKIQKYTLYLAVFLTPIFFLPLSQDALEYPKQILLVIFVFLGLISWSLYQLIEKKTQIRVHKAIYIILGVLLLFSLLSCIFSIWKHGSFFGWPLSVSGNFLSLLVFVAFVFLIYNTCSTEKEILTLIFLLTLSSFLAGIFTLLQIYNIFIFPFNFTKTSSFGLLGNPNASSLFFASLLLLVFCASFLGEDKRKKIFFRLSACFFFFLLLSINFQTAWIALFFGSLTLLLLLVLRKNQEKNPTLVGFSAFCLFLSLFFIFFRVPIPLFPISPPEVTLTLNSEYEILRGTFSEGIKNILLGTGPGTFIFDYSKYRSPLLNQTIFWGTRFPSGYSAFFDLIITQGILGTIGLLALWAGILILGIRKFLKANNENQRLLLLGMLSSFVILILSYLLYPVNFSIHFLMFTFVGLILTTEGLSVKKESSGVRNFSFNFIAAAIFIAVFVVSSCFIFFACRGYIANIFYTKGMQEFSLKRDFDSAILKIQKSTQLNPFIDQYWRDLAQIHLAYANSISSDKNLTFEAKQRIVMENISKGIKALNRAIKINPKNVANWNVRGFFYRNLIGLKGAGENALESYRRAIQLEPASPFAFGEMARVYILMAQDFANKGEEKAKEDALKYAKQNLEKAISLKPDYAPAHYLLAVVYDQQGKIDEAIGKLEETIKITPKDAGIVFQLGVLYWRKQDLENAEKAFKKAVEINSNYSNARYMLGLVYDKLKKIDKAKEQFEMVLQLNPDNKDVKKILDNLNQGKPALEGILPAAPPIQETPSELQK